MNTTRVAALLRELANELEATPRKPRGGYARPGAVKPFGKLFAAQKIAQQFGLMDELAAGKMRHGTFPSPEIKRAFEAELSKQKYRFPFDGRARAGNAGGATARGNVLAGIAPAPDQTTTNTSCGAGQVSTAASTRAITAARKEA